MDTDGGTANIELIPASQLCSGAACLCIDSNRSPIYKIHHDILLLIFQINADMDQDPLWRKDERITQESPRAMNATRNSSQVNSLWRNLLIGAPTLWASLIDVDYLKVSGEWWRNEVVRRTSNSPLHVKGHVIISSLDKPHQWLLAFFNDNWSRIRKFDLGIQSGLKNVDWFPQLLSLDHARATEYRKYLSFLSRPSSTLESFRLQLPHLCDPLETGAAMFGEYAPQLIDFEVNNMRFTPQSNWLPQLRTLHIHEFHAQTFKSGDVLCQVLSQMPNLESLSLTDAVTDYSISAHQGSIHLPHLQYLCVRNMGWDVILGNNHSTPSTPFSGWSLLGRIIPQTGCTFKFYLSPSQPTNVDATVLIRFAKNYLQSHEPTKLDIIHHNGILELALNRTALEIGMESEITLLESVSDLSPSILLPCPPDVKGVKYRVFDSFIDHSFSRVTHLCLVLGHFEGFSPEWRELLTGFTSVEILTTTSSTIDSLWDPQMLDSLPLFPSLKVLKIPAETFHPLFDLQAHPAVPIASFLNRRKEAGRPVETLEYYSPSMKLRPWSRRVLDDFRCLDDVAGLKVVWKLGLLGGGEYICGSGHPEELDFAQRSRYCSRIAREAGME